VQCEKTIDNLQNLFMVRILVVILHHSSSCLYAQINMHISTYKRVVAIEEKLDDVHRLIVSSSSPSSPKSLTPSSTSFPPFINSPLRDYPVDAGSNSTDTESYTSGTGSSKTLVATPLQLSPRVPAANPKIARERSPLRPSFGDEYEEENRRSQSLEPHIGGGKSSRPSDKGDAKKRADTMATPKQQRKNRDAAGGKSSGEFFCCSSGV